MSDKSVDWTDAPKLSLEEFEAAIRAVGAERYHDKHPFHKALHGGKLNKGQVAAWALNRYCYQEAVPRKDAALMSRAESRDLRREWIHRIHDHDGLEGEPGGIERWLVLTDGLGLEREYVISKRGALPATRFAVEAYVRFVVEQPLTVAVASSLTELFAPKIHRERISGMLENYDFIGDDVMAYFKRRLAQAPRDADFALDYIKQHARDRATQEACVDAVRFKCNVLWSQLDALQNAYVAGNVPPGGVSTLMARDRGLEELIRSELPSEPFTEKGMFGGYAWLLHGNLVCGARSDGLLARLGKGRDGWALALPGIVPMTVRERTMEGWVRAAPEAFGDDGVRRRLLEAAVAFARTLPPK